MSSVTINGKKYDSIEDYMAGKEKLPEIKAGEIAKINSEYKSDNKVTVIPEGFTVSGISTEQNIDEGLVIYDIPEEDLKNAGEDFWTKTITEDEDNTTFPEVQSKYNQFVWVPVDTPYVTTEEVEEIINKSNGTIKTEVEAIQTIADNGIYPMSLQQSNGVDYKGIIYSYSTVDLELKTKVRGCKGEPYALTSTTSVSLDLNREPSQEILQNDYNEIVRSIIDKKGFWVGRYQVKANTETNFESKRGNGTKASWYDMYDGCKTMYTDKSVKSYMITGSQWFQILTWMRDVKNIEDNTRYFIEYSAGMGTYNDSWGIRDVRNIFDLAGYYAEWSTLVEVNERAVLGGDMFSSKVKYDGRVDSTRLQSYGSNGYPISPRSLSPEMDNVCSSRVILY